MYLTQPLAIDPDWLARSALEVAPDLLGCTLVRQFADGQTLRGTIVETEAYTAGDPAMHAYRRRTARNSVMFEAAGLTYVYLIYGMYHCLNVVTDVEGVPSAVLLRAAQLEAIPSYLLEPPILLEQAIEQPIKQKKPVKKPVNLAKVAAGPGKLCRALQIDLSLTAQPLRLGEPLWLEHRSQTFQQALASGAIDFVQTTRIGLTQGKDLPWRWYIKDHAAVSKF